MKYKNVLTLRYSFALATIILGVILEYLEIGQKFFEFNSVGTWLIYVGLVMIAVITLQIFVNKKKVIDERMMLMAYKSSRVTFVVMLLTAFIIMIIDGISPITTPYSLFMSYIISYMVAVYFFAYKILERYN